MLCYARYDDKFRDSMRKRAINGKVRCALRGLTWPAGARVRLHLLAMGDEELHAPLLSGHTFDFRSRRTAAAGLMASTMKTVDLVSHAAGEYLLRSASRSGADRGMQAIVSVTAGTEAPVGSKKRTYYLAADEVQWDFLPFGTDLCPGSSLDRVRTTRAEQVAPPRPA
jgi:hephaestin